MSKSIDELELQRLVDGEMTDDDRSAFLGRLDRQPESWREVALAFVEEQIWRREIGEARRVHIDATEPRVEARISGRKTSWGRAAALAAGLLILPCLGFYLGQVTERASVVAVSKDGGIGANRTGETRQAVPSTLPDNVETVANQRLASLGYRLDSETQYFSGQLDDGRQLVVPVRTVMVNYYGQ